MAEREKKEVRKLPQESEVEVDYSDQWVPLPAGDYVFEVGRLGFIDGSAAEQVQIPLTVLGSGKYTGAVHKEHISLSTAARWKLMEFFAATQIEQGKKPWKQVIKEVYQRKVRGTIYLDEYDGKEIRKLERLWPYVEGESLDPVIPDDDVPSKPSGKKDAAPSSKDSSAKKKGGDDWGDDSDWS